MSANRDPIAILLANPADHLRGLDLPTAMARTLNAVLASRATVALFLPDATPTPLGRQYDLSCALGALAGWENAWGELCKEARPLLAQARGVHSFGAFTSACEALCLAGTNALRTAWTTLVAAAAEDCPLAALGLAPWGVVEVQRIVEGCLAHPELTAQVAASFREGEEAEATAQLEIEALIRLSQQRDSAGKRKKAKPLTITKSFPTPNGATWDNVCIWMSDQRIRVEVLGKRKEFTFQEAGFEEKRRGNVPDRLWILLRQFAVHGGILPANISSLPEQVRTNLKQNVSQLGKRLVELFVIDGKPFKDTHVTRRYETRFKIFAEEGLHFPTPDGLTWDGVSIAEVRTGVITVRADAVDTHGVYNPPNAEEESPGRWEAVVQTGALTREYDLRSLGLADEESNFTPVGEAFLAVLRGGGKIQRKNKDKSMLSLGRHLCDLMQINASPFQFSKAQQIWSALFEASSSVLQPSR